MKQKWFHLNSKFWELIITFKYKSVATFKSKINISIPQNAWKLLFKFKRILLKRCIVFKQSFYLLAHWMQEWHLFIISTRGWSKKIKSIVNCEDMQPSLRSRDEKIQWLILGILCKLFWKKSNGFLGFYM